MSMSGMQQQQQQWAAAHHALNAGGGGGMMLGGGHEARGLAQHQAMPPALMPATAPQYAMVPGLGLVIVPGVNPAHHPMYSMVSQCNYGSYYG